MVVKRMLKCLSCWLAICLDESVAAQIVFGVLAALRQLGELAHLDLKPDNIMIRINGDVVLIDLDTVRLKSDAKHMSVEVCTPAYAAPELIDGTFRHVLYSLEMADIFSLGLLTEELACGMFPGEGISLICVRMQGKRRPCLPIPSGNIR